MISCRPRWISLKRAPRAIELAGLTVPCATWRSALPAVSISPQPVWMDPGSMPRMISRWGRPAPLFDRGATSLACLLHQLGGNIEIRGDALNVIMIFQFFGEFQDL